MNEASMCRVQLLPEVASAVFEAPAFVVKGGTALKLFAQDMPRLSVDLDVVFVRHELARDEVMKSIGDERAAVQGRIRNQEGTLLRHASSSWRGPQ
ncbi:nucleotidyl transferase AbiEii/AbiGii toxin family protein [Paucibacter sp. PLA-PC-4]|uniref:nucleotidyl transferase AbiEii/AbiGii toxin family protein n=1 Tax=Paucibacter sp. PLA-PC-4 TaxID=2993655 RepID=UPI00224AF24F|nr:nucleotidyl transferase AbiEii/AbiGii toxin family protein [Paucibacter sp. PLA-PC-4]MCX2864905.1 nucleotidyl transferase AbiEii/AbiGii toxin family protein [Paucibacter sp. PLA-PC-4]